MRTRARVERARGRVNRVHGAVARTRTRVRQTRARVCNADAPIPLAARALIVKAKQMRAATRIVAGRSCRGVDVVTADDQSLLSASDCLPAAPAARSFGL